LREEKDLTSVPPTAIIGILSIGITIGWAYYAARLLALSGRGAFEGSWRNIAIGAIATAIGIAFLTASDFVGALWIGITGSAMIAVGGAFMFLALVSQYSIWKRMLSSDDSKKILQSFATSSVKSISAQASPAVEKQMTATLVDRGPFSEFSEGKKTILEFDPASDYEGYVARIVRETLSTGSTVVLFTKQGSTLSGLKGVKMVLLSFSEQDLKLSPEGTLWVSITNPSLILDAFTSVAKSDPRARIVVDNLTDLTLNLGFEKTYNLLQEMNEVIAGSKSSLLLLFNLKAHDEQTRAAFEGYSNAILSFDSSGLHIQKGAALSG
jgi:hypothetical protein